jgi:hypothetical protein
MAGWAEDAPQDRGREHAEADDRQPRARPRAVGPAPCGSTTGSVHGTVSRSPLRRFTALSTMPETNPAAAVQAAIAGVRAVIRASRSRLGMRKPASGGCLRASRPAWMSHIVPATAPIATLTLAARLKLPWIAPQTCVAGLCGNAARLESWAAPTSRSTTGSMNRPTGVRGLVTVK